MATATFVKKARKDIPGTDIKKGDSYWWWSFRFGGKHTSRTQPKPSQLTQSEYTSTVLALQERDQPGFDDLESEIEDIKSELENLRDNTQEKFDNMPEGLQQGDTGQLLESRVSSLDDAIGALENISIPDESELRDDLPESDKDDEETEDEKLDRIKQEKSNELWMEVQDALGNIEI